MKFDLLPTDVEVLNGIIAITSVSGYRALDLKLTASKEIDAPTADQPYNGKVLMQIACNQSFAEMCVPAVVQQEGVCVTNSYLLGQLPYPNDARTPWSFSIENNRLKAVCGRQFEYTFEIGEEEMHRYDPVYGNADINITSIVDSIGLLGNVLRGFVSRKSTDASGLNGAVRMTGNGNEVTFQATNGISDAVIGTKQVPVTIARPFDILLPVAQFESWKSLPKSVPVFMTVDEAHQLTLNVNNGQIKIQHNTLSNLLGAVENVAEFAARFNAVETPEDFEELKLSMRYQPEDLEAQVSNATIFADNDPTLIFNTDSVKNNANIVVRTSVADSNIDLDKVEVVKHGNMSVNRSSLSLLNKLKLFRENKIPQPPSAEELEAAGDGKKGGSKKANAANMTPTTDDFMVLRVFEGVVMIGTPDASWIGITSEMSI